jgi:hypothetical protein
MNITDPYLAPFLPITLAEAEAVKLQNRVDTKFVFPVAQLPGMLEMLREDYRVLEIGGTRSQHYQTLYFDTPAHLMYLNHHNGKANRFKVRSRRYLDTGQCFFEVKVKNNKGRTLKARSIQDGRQDEISESHGEILSGITGLSPGQVEPALWVTFSRITLVNRARTERITIDTDLRFLHGNDVAGYPGIVIAELKQDHTCSSLFQHLLHQRHINGTKISKYCLGIISLNPHIKQNRFKEKLILINKLNHD